MEAIIQVFQDEYHLRTLDTLLSSIAKFHPNINIKQIIITFIDRLTAFAKRERDQRSADEDSNENVTDSGIPEDIKLFEIFWEQVSSIIKVRTELSLEDVSSLLLSLMNLGINCYPDRMDYVQKLFTFSAEFFREQNK